MNFSNRLIALFLLLIFSVRAEAVVMYDEGREMIDNISFLRDKENPNEYYYLPTIPSVALDRETGKPKISLIKFVDPAGKTSGGLVHFLFSLDLPKDRLEELEEELKKKIPGATIKGPVVLRAEGDEEAAGASFKIISSTLTDNAGEDAFTSSLVSSGVAPVTLGSQAAVAARLNEHGATLLWESLTGPTSDISVSISASYEAALPAYRGSVKADIETVYEHLFKVFNQQEGYQKTEIRNQFDEMVREGVIEVDITDRAGLSVNTSQLTGVMNLVTDKLVNMIFDTTQGLSKLPEQEEVPSNVVAGRQEQGFLTKLFAGSGNKKYVTDDQYTMRNKTDIKRGNFSLLFTQNSTIRVPFNTTGNISGLYKEWEKDKSLARVIGLNDPSFQRREIFFEVDPEFSSLFSHDINSVSVEFIKKYPESMNQSEFTGELVFNQKDVAEANFSKSIAYPRLGLDGSEWLDYEYRALWSFRGGYQVGMPIDMDKSSYSSAPSQTLVPPAQVTKVEIEGNNAALSEGKVKRVNVTFSYRLLGKEVNKRARINPENDKLITLSLLHDRNSPVKYKINWYLDQKDGVQQNYQTLEDTYLLIGTPPPEEGES